MVQCVISIYILNHRLNARRHNILIVKKFYMRLVKFTTFTTLVSVLMQVFLLNDNSVVECKRNGQQLR